jgi:hypothetical protein
MSSSISLTWSRCHVIVRGGGWFRLAGVPIHLSEQASARLAELGADAVSVLEPGVIQFSSGSEAAVHCHLARVFPTCPLPVPLAS